MTLAPKKKAPPSLPRRLVESPTMRKGRRALTREKG
jgi:hypothetical protein